MDATPKGNRLHVALFGRTNVGKSSLLNYLLGQEVAITSPVAGTTTDVVEKAAELLPLGPVLFLDTAGLDDITELSAKRLEKTRRILDRADAILLVTEAEAWTDFEESLLGEAKARKIPVVPIVNKTDLRTPSEEFLASLREKTGRVLAVSSTDGAGREAALEAVKRHLLETAPDHFLEPPPLVGDLLPPGGLAVLVVPIDLQAPKGRLILPQVQTIRDALDSDAAALMVKERELAAMLARLSRPPDLVVTDSQAILKVSGDTPQNVPLTTFSILMARQKGDLATAAVGVAAIEDLRPGDPVLIAEACTHHPLQDDIGRVKIPRWLRQYVGGELAVDVSAGRDYPQNLSRYRLVLPRGARLLKPPGKARPPPKAPQARGPHPKYRPAHPPNPGVLPPGPSPLPPGLYIVGTPIGNLGDITLRAIETLKSAHLIVAEDTRHTRHLLDRYEIRTPTISCHKFNEASRVELVLGKIREGQAVALVTDAGMPAVSDPGSRVVAACHDAGVPVIVIPGPSSVNAAVALSGFGGAGFFFEGFLSHKSAARAPVGGAGRLRSAGGPFRVAVPPAEIAGRNRKDARRATGVRRAGNDEAFRGTSAGPRVGDCGAVWEPDRQGRDRRGDRDGRRSKVQGRKSKVMF